VNLSVTHYNGDFGEENNKAYAGIIAGGNGSLLLAQLCESAFTVAWVRTFVTPCLYFLKRMN